MVAPEVAGVVLAAGEGRRLRPLSDVRPKALCTVAARPLLGWALERLRPYVAEVAVNVHAHVDLMRAWLDSHDVHVSVEPGEARGTAGALGLLHDWIDGRPVMVTNADAWCPPQTAPVLADLVAGWDGERPRLLCTRPEHPGDGVFDGLRYSGTCLLPWWSVRGLTAEPTGLYEVSWRGLHAEGRLDLVETDEPVIDCGTPADYLRANLLATGGDSVMEPGARVEGTLVRSVVWAGEAVGAHETLVEAVRGAGTTLQPFATSSPG
jgi:N-acetyl-alpha-D-muramate 1-phosphate uridylyltransferase